MGTLVSIVYKPRDVEPSAEGYLRVSLHEARLVAGYGIEGDAKGGANDRHLNVMSVETMQQLADEGFSAASGMLGEQLIFAGVDVDALARGERVRIGETACVEITIPRTGCAKLERHQGKPRQEAAGRLGVMARVVEGGTIAVGDLVARVAAEEVLDSQAALEL